MALNNRQMKKSTHIKTIKAHKAPTQQQENVPQSNTNQSSFSKNQFQRIDAETFTPLAAKDSGWVDLRIHDTNNANYSQINGDVDTDDEVTIELCEGDRRQQSPMALLFPNLSEADLTRKTSPTAITKLLVGQKVNLKYLKNAKKNPQFFQVSVWKVLVYVFYVFFLKF